MQVICNNCNAKYKISDDKLKGRSRIRLKCKKCDNIIEAKVNNIADEDTSNLFSMSSSKNIANSIKNDESKDDIFEDSLFSGNKDEFLFEDAKKTLVLNKQVIDDIENDKKKTGNTQFKSNFQMDFSDKTSQINTFEKKAGSANKSAAISFETTQQISVEKFNEYQQSKGRGVDSRLDIGSKATLDVKMKDKFEEISKEFSDKPQRTGSFIFKFIFLLLFISSLFFVFVLYKNNWNLELDKFPKMIDNAINTHKGSKISHKVKIKSLREQFLIDTKSIKTRFFKLFRGKRNKTYVLVVSGKIKNIDNKKKSLTTVSVKVNNILNKQTILDKRVYAGNIFTKKEIIKAKNEDTLDSEYLQSGKNGSNWGVMPNKTVPFMVVFYLKEKLNIKEIKIKIEIKSTQ